MIRFLLRKRLKLQYAKRREKAYPFHHVNDVSVYLGRQREGGSLIERTGLKPHLVVPLPVSNVCEVKNIPLLEECVQKMRSLIVDPSLCLPR